MNHAEHIKVRCLVINLWCSGMLYLRLSIFVKFYKFIIIYLLQCNMTERKDWTSSKHKAQESFYTTLKSLAHVQMV